MMPCLTIKDASELANVSRWTLIRWVKPRFVRAVKKDESIRIEAESLRAFLDTKKTDTKKVKS